VSRPVLVQGLGAIGRAIAEAARDSVDFDLAGVVDVDPVLAGRRVIDGVPQVFPTLSAAHLHAPEADLVLHATSSWLEEVTDQLVEAVGLGLSVVSTCEELVWPYATHPEQAQTIHRKALAAGRAVLGTGVNPGFLMDRLVVFLRSASRDVRRVEVERYIAPGPRRLAFRDKVGIGMPRADYQARVASDHFGHVGLRQSAELIAAGLGWGPLQWHTSQQPVLAKDGETLLGVAQQIDGASAEHGLSLRFVVHEGIRESVDRIVVEGTPSLALKFEGGVAGEQATVAAVLEGARVLPSAPRGLVTVLDLPLRVRGEATADPR